MKKILFIVVVSILAVIPAHAQFSHLDIHLGTGYTRLADDIISTDGLLGASVGICVDYSFTTSKSVMADHFYLQTGVNLVRRGGHYAGHYELAAATSMDKSGYYKLWYAQVPLLAHFYYTMPETPEHRFFAFVGPALCIGTFGTYRDLLEDNDHPNAAVNHLIDDEPAFNYVKRLDVDAIFGVGYQYNNLMLRLYVDYGFLAVNQSDDVLRKLENELNGSDYNIVIPNGNVVSFMFSLGYRIPLQEQPARRHPRDYSF